MPARPGRTLAGVAAWVATGVAATLLLACGHGVRVPPFERTDAVTDGRWVWDLPPGFPPPRVPDDNPMSAAKVELGRRLFEETRLSSNGRTACATCHEPARAFTDGGARAVGTTGEVHRRNAMSLTNVAYNATLTWSGAEVTTLEQQARIPLLNEDPIEMGMAGREDEILDRLRRDRAYPDRFAAAFGDPAIDLERVTYALAAFQRTLISGRSPYDRYVFDDDRDALSPSARRGMALFFSERLRCATCHAGLNFSGPVRTADEAEPARPAFHNNGLYDLDGRGAYPADDRGLIESTGRPEDMGRFRAPTLRNVARTAPYMHDGSLETLGAVVDHYAAGGVGSPLQAEEVAGFDLTAAERGDLLAFLDALSDGP